MFHTFNDLTSNHFASLFLLRDQKIFKLLPALIILQLISSRGLFPQNVNFTSYKILIILQDQLIKINETIT